MCRLGKCQKVCRQAPRDECVQRIERSLEGVDGAVEVLQPQALLPVLLLLVAGNQLSKTLVVGFQLLALFLLFIDLLLLLLEALGQLLVGVDEGGDARRDLNLSGGLL